MDELVAFLRARMDEEYEAARKDAAEAMTGYLWKYYPEAAYNELQQRVLASSKRVLADVEAKRRIVEWVARLGAAARPPGDLGRDMTITDGRYRVLWEVIRLLALPFADHPDYREEWRP